jgi:hypothetical protein
MSVSVRGGTIIGHNPYLTEHGKLGFQLPRIMQIEKASPKTSVSVVVSTDQGDVSAYLPPSDVPTLTAWGDAERFSMVGSYIVERGGCVPKNVWEGQNSARGEIRIEGGKLLAINECGDPPTEVNFNGVAIDGRVVLFAWGHDTWWDKARGQWQTDLMAPRSAVWYRPGH